MHHITWRKNCCKSGVYTISIWCHTIDILKHGIVIKTQKFILKAYHHGFNTYQSLFARSRQIFHALFLICISRNNLFFLFIKKLSFCHKLWFSNFNIVATQGRRPLIFQTMNAIRSNNVSLNYQRFQQKVAKI